MKRLHPHRACQSHANLPTGQGSKSSGKPSSQSLCSAADWVDHTLRGSWAAQDNSKPGSGHEDFLKVTSAQPDESPPAP